jgi:hypothetical protein
MVRQFAFVFLILSSVSQLAKADRCAHWVGTSTAANLGRGNFHLHMYSGSSRAEFRKDWPIVCDLLVPRKVERLVSQLCIAGDLDAAIPFMSALAPTEIGIHNETLVHRFLFVAKSPSGLVFEVESSQRTGYRADAVNCGEDGAPACQNPKTCTPNSVDGSCSPVETKEWTAPFARKILVPICAPSLAGGQL